MWYVEGIVFKKLISFGVLNTKDNAVATFRLGFCACSQLWKFH